ncbi:hypothetical protein [Photobacterium profundum]|nr:hypothetical protein [Photobacterium profundum]
MNKGDPWPEWPVFWREFSVVERKLLAEEVGAAVLYLRNVGKQDVQVGPVMARKIEAACGYPKELLRPDIFGED